MLDNKILLLILIGYMRKANHPTETDIEIMGNVMFDIEKTKKALEKADMSKVTRQNL